jgi:hypothetical protein
MTAARQFLSRRAQARRYGKSTKTIKRWGEDPKMGMPPEYDFNGLPSRALDELEPWERSRVAASSHRHDPSDRDAHDTA